MTVNELIDKLQKFVEDGRGDNLVCIPTGTFGGQDVVKGAMKSESYSNVVLIHNFTESDLF